MAELTFRRDFQPAYGQAVAVAPNVRRVTAPNAGPFTFRGTNSYIVGSGRVAVIDPGPADEGHLAALMEATSGETVAGILLTHTHRDHSGNARRLAGLTGAPIYGFAGQAPARPAGADGPALDIGGDRNFATDIALRDGAFIEGGGWRLEAVATPGHASDHLAFALAGGDLLFSGDHVMGWSTTVVVPPDGSMAAYMASLDRLLARGEETYLPGHGGAVEQARRHVQALKEHRHTREAEILAALAGGPATIPEIVATVYRGLDASLSGAAAFSVLAHIEDLVTRGAVAAEGQAGLAGRYRLSRR